MGPPTTSERSLAEEATLQAVGSRNAGMYGEITPFSLVQMFSALDFKPGLRFYDIGSGTGKLVALAALLGYHATGVEIVKDRYEACRKVLIM